ncbi:uncharacterized protein LOC113493692 [Trichoplusia ni]|uniref:Uncharacterized protein LOC113493692 n=1 Tax=Trichoplusia ni TaxID=7111 RepID=A0A7E5VGQ0_TRINI|nr:uncharacterized protein LOC113493692 [Trichoplusia ni]
MSYVKNNDYRNLPFCAETPFGNFYTYSDLRDIPDKCYLNKDEIIKCRTVGILQSLNGRYYLSDMETGQQSEPLVQVSVVYLKSPPQSTIIPYPVQVFGMLQWKKRPVIFATILQIMNVKTAIRVKNALSAIAKFHLSEIDAEQNCKEELLS